MKRFTIHSLNSLFICLCFFWGCGTTLSDVWSLSHYREAPISLDIIFFYGDGYYPSQFSELKSYIASKSKVGFGGAFNPMNDDVKIKTALERLKVGILVVSFRQTDHQESQSSSYSNLKDVYVKQRHEASLYVIDFKKIRYFESLYEVLDKCEKDKCDEVWSGSATVHYAYGRTTGTYFDAEELTTTKFMKKAIDLLIKEGLIQKK